jgi:hypothetical protein
LTHYRYFCRENSLAPLLIQVTDIFLYQFHSYKINNQIFTNSFSVAGKIAQRLKKIISLRHCERSEAIQTFLSGLLRLLRSSQLSQGRYVKFELT